MDVRQGARRIRAAGAIALLMVVAGCADDQRTADVAATAAEFYGAAAQGHWAAACGWLAPEVIDELDHDGGCIHALPAADLPDDGWGAGVRTQVWGRSAQVASSADVAFLALFPDGWRITAAGCQRQDDRPYQCSIGS